MSDVTSAGGGSGEFSGRLDVSAIDDRTLEVFGGAVFSAPGIRDLLEVAIAEGHGNTALRELPVEVVQAAYARRHPEDQEQDTLVGAYGEVDTITCDVMNVDVIVRGDNGAQTMGRIGLGVEFKPNVAPLIPEDCPLTVPKADRSVGSFATCLECSHSMISSGGDDGFFEC